LPNAESLTDYFNSAWDNAKGLDEKIETVNGLIPFFRTGVLYFKPVSTIITTVNPFRDLFKRMTDDELKLIGGITLPYAAQETGIGSFDLNKAVGELNVISELIDENSSSSTNMSIKPFAVETCFGYWVPNALDRAWQLTLDESSSKKRLRWKEFRNKIVNAGDGVLVGKYREYLDAVEKELAVIPRLQLYRDNLAYDPFSISIFERFISRVLMHLGDDDRLDRLTKPFISGAMPEIWDDGQAYKDFCTSFFEYLELVSSAERKSYAPSKILEKIEPYDSPDGKQLSLSLKFDKYLEEFGWTDGDWGSKYR